MNLLPFLAVAVVVGSTYSGAVTIEGIGEIALPSGKWKLEYAVTPAKNSNTPDVYVFRKEGDRFERLTFQKYGPHIVLPIHNYLDSIGDSVSEGIPLRLLKDRSAHDSVIGLRGIIDLDVAADGKVNCIATTYLYTSETKDPWMSHAFVCERNGWVLVGIHASPHAISPGTVEDVYDQSKFEKGADGK